MRMACSSLPPTNILFGIPGFPRAWVPITATLSGGELYHPRLHGVLAQDHSSGDMGAGLAVGHAGRFSAAAIALLMGQLAHALCLWKGGSEVPEEWVKTSYSPLWGMVSLGL